MIKHFTTKADETPEFVEFWNSWRPYARHTDGRGDARDTFFKHVNAGADPRDITDGAKYFIRTMKERDKEYIPLAASWINKRAYEDMAESERALQQRVVERAQAANVVPIQQPKESPERRAEMAARLREVASSMRVTGQ
ncbi:hypothetical protein [Rhizobium ecuadorense]|uniref:hypothetical protein n=1 Tax=Rhizobium ecuadorense TaxID=1671795 RepID=UPI00067331FC|nr:hypothetical protein [Rhizobium ecuadorense]